MSGRGLAVLGRCDSRCTQAPKERPFAFPTRAAALHAVSKALNGDIAYRRMDAITMARIVAPQPRATPGRMNMGTRSVKRILFICMGNICRSPSAEGVFRHVLATSAPDLQIEIDSASTHDYHVGAPPPWPTQGRRV